MFLFVEKKRESFFKHMQPAFWKISKFLTMQRMYFQNGLPLVQINTGLDPLYTTQ